MCRRPPGWMSAVVLCLAMGGAAQAQKPKTAPATAEEEVGFVRKRIGDGNGTKTPYWLFVPHNYNRVASVPVILFLHGSGSVKGGTLPTEAGLGPYIRPREKAFPYLVVFPQAEEEGWKPKGATGKMALSILDKTMREYKTDRNRVIVTGLSMGGTGTWRFAVAEPQRWAAIVPICGVSAPDKVDNVKDIPCWVFHGDADQSISVNQSRSMVAALRNAGAHPHYVEFPKVGHNCWDQAYATPALWTWLAAQKRK